jgi:hypothetical protein
MPYEGELASKAAHFDLLNNPDIKAMLDECNYLQKPSDEVAQNLASRFIEPPTDPNVPLPKAIIAVDGSDHETSLDQKLPSTKFGFIKIGAILIYMDQLDKLRDGNLVDPFEVAKLQKNNTALHFFVPSANIRWRDIGNVRDSFRALLDQQLLDERTRLQENDYRSSLRTTLFKLASLRPGEMGTNDDYHLKVHKCPNCDQGPLTLEDKEGEQPCEYCGKPVYPSDCLRLWEAVSEHQSNQIVLSRLMMNLEHLIPAHYMRYCRENYPLQLKELAFFVDGPLAMFGNAAWIHRAMMIFLQRTNHRLTRDSARPILMIGLQKTGQIVDYINLIDRFIPNNRLLAVDDDFRYQYIYNGREPSASGFGYETYYGQDFIYKTPSGRVFNFLLPYPYDNKDFPNFPQEKIRFENYQNLPLALTLINHFESDLYKNAVVPVALAHRYTSISLMPGGKMLDIMAQQSLTNHEQR